jgi:hypothetical protein
MSRKQVRIAASAAGSPGGTVPGDVESWVGRAAQAAMPEPMVRMDSTPGMASSADLLRRYGDMLSQCRTPQDLVALQLWAMRAQCELGLAQASRVALSFGAALGTAAARIAPRA